MAGTIVLTTDGGAATPLGVTIVDPGAVGVAGETLTPSLTLSAGITAGGVAVAGQSVSWRISTALSQGGVTAAGQTVTVANALATSITAGAVSVAGQTITPVLDEGDEIFAASASRTHVLAAIALAEPGDTVVVPAGTASWSGDVDITGITLIGEGKDSGTPTTITAGTVTLTKHATHITRMSGFRFTANGRHVQVDGDSVGTEMFFIDDNYFSNDGASAIYLGANGGVFYGNELINEDGTGSDVFQVAPTDDDWSEGTTLGTEDTTGKRNVYIEDNVFSGIRETAPDCDTGARTVIRHNVYNDSSIVLHSGSPNDSSPRGGHRHTEIYENTFNRVDGENQPVNKWVWVRGGSGVIRDNVWDEVSTQEFPGKNEIQLSVGCPGAWPIQYQVGQTSITAASPVKPLVILNNSSPQNISISEGPIATCGSPSTYVQSGRDYVFTQTWSYTKYTYPHPLRP